MSEKVAINTMLAHHRIVSKLGVGGMGEVYPAQNSQLNRTVVLKILLADGGANQSQSD